MFYRRKIILGLLELLNNNVGKIRLQKLLFLYAQRKEKPEYEFIPYKFGCYSYSAKADLRTMVKKGLLSEDEKYYYNKETGSYFDQLKVKDQKLLKQTVSDYNKMTTNALIKHTYLNFPFYAINSTIAEDVLSEKYFHRIEEARPNDITTTLFTIGYEGISLENYLLKLVKNNIKLLVDVRRNARSMKFGFSKTLLQKYCNSLGISYKHIPEVGIVSKKRRNLNSQEDYDELFAEYRNTTLKETKDAQLKILQLLNEYNRIALTCFEAEPCQCHRTHLANSLYESPEFSYPLIHL
ncbi:MAG TPA: DUF488 domain-containing protein [Flavobacteriaceae bacterium]|nr:DUF488 domain-containing protein [Flavobacteriaceae bacterium]